MKINVLVKYSISAYDWKDNENKINLEILKCICSFAIFEINKQKQMISIIILNSLKIISVNISIKQNTSLKPY